MVELKDKINKPRSFRGTPTYAFVNKAAFVGIGAGLVLAALIGLRYDQVQRRDDPDYGTRTLRTVHEERQESRVKVYVTHRKQILSSAEENKRDEEYRLK